MCIAIFTTWLLSQSSATRNTNGKPLKTCEMCACVSRSTCYALGSTYYQHDADDIYILKNLLLMQITYLQSLEILHHESKGHVLAGLETLCADVDLLCVCVCGCVRACVCVFACLTRKSFPSLPAHKPTKADQPTFLKKSRYTFQASRHRDSAGRDVMRLSSSSICV